MTSKVNKYPKITAVRVNDGFDTFTAEMYVPYTANSRNEKLELRPFVFIDGEGVRLNETDEFKPRRYALIGASTGERLKGLELSTQQIFAWLIGLKAKYPKALFVGFAFNYDVNMICKDIPVAKLERIRKAKRTQWDRYTILYMPNKKFQITDRLTHLTFSVSDVFTFFGCAFVKACEQYLGEHEPRLERVREGKYLRSEFWWHELDTLVEPYMSMELELGVELIQRLRHYLFEAGIRPRGWHGPGAVASAIITKEGVRHAMHKLDRSVEMDCRLIEWSRRAYFGGRFEQMWTGYYDGPIYQYDIKSAYPYALTHCPDLSRGSWTLRKTPTDNGSQFKLYALRYKNLGAGRTDWHPLPRRSNRQTIHYQAWVHGIYWGPEAEVVLSAFPNQIEIVGVLEYDDDGTRPFEFIHEMYAQRAEWVAKGNPAQLALKLGMNSLYGKLAQRVGWNESKLEAPPSHQLEWAGFTTSWCRAMMLETMLQKPDAIVALETDGLFSTEPLIVDMGTGLGQMEVDEWDGIVYIQSGVYFKRYDHLWQPGKTRGFGKNTLDVSDALDHAIGLESMTTEQNRFVGMAYAGTERWRKFLPHEHIVQWGGNGKRYHDPKNCVGCTEHGTWHQTTWAPGMGGYESYPHTLPWIDGFSNPYQIETDYKEEFVQ